MNTTTRSYESSGWETASTATSERFNSGSSVKDMAPTSAHRGGSRTRERSEHHHGGRRERDAVPRHVGMPMMREDRDYPRHRGVVVPQDLKYLGQDPRVPRELPVKYDRGDASLYGEKFLRDPREESTIQTPETASLTSTSGGASLPFPPPTDGPQRGQSLDMSSISGTHRDRYHGHDEDPYERERYIPDDSHRSAPAGNGRYAHHPEDRYYHGPPPSRRGPPQFRGPPPPPHSYHSHDPYSHPPHPEDDPYYHHDPRVRRPVPYRPPMDRGGLDRSHNSAFDERGYSTRRGPPSRGGPYHHPRDRYHSSSRYDDYADHRRSTMYEDHPYHHEHDDYPPPRRGPPPPTRGGHGPRMPPRTNSRDRVESYGPNRMPPRSNSRDSVESYNNRMPPRSLSRDDSVGYDRNSTTMARSNSHHSANTDSNSVVMVDISPGVQARLRRINETMDAVAKDYYTAVCCLACQRELFCIADVEYFLCPDCKVISPLEEPDAGSKPHGLGMGFHADTLMAMQSEVFAKKHAARNNSNNNGGVGGY